MSLKRFYKRNKVLVILTIILLIFLAYYIYLHRHPRTDNAFLVANVRPVSAFVPGHITNIYVRNNQRVSKGDKLFTVFQKPYKLQVKKLQSQINSAKYKLDALKQQLVVSELTIRSKEASYKNTDYLARQALTLDYTHAVADKEAEQRVQDREVAREELLIAKANYIMTRQNINEEEENVASLTAQLEDAEVDLSLTTVYAQSNGIISNMYVSVGTYAETGKALFSFVDTDTWWVQANLKETELNNVTTGQKVWIKLWLYPDRVFEGEVGDIGWNVNRLITSSTNYLPEVENENEWFLLPQRFPVQIKITDKDIKNYPLHMGASATVVVDTSDNIFRHLFWKFNWW